MSKSLRTKVFALCAGILLLPVYGAVTTPSVKLQAVGNKMELVSQLPGGDWQKAELKMEIFDGKSGKFLSDRAQITDMPGKVIVQISGKDYTYVTEFSARNELIYGKAVFTNNSKEEKWIEPGLKAKADFSKTPEIFWDGFGKTRKIGKTPLERKSIKGVTLEHIGSKELPFPAAGAFGKKSGIHLGHVIFDPVSYSAAFYDPGTSELRFTQRYAVHPGETLNFTWVAGNVSSLYENAGAVVQQHYDAFPEKWAVDQENPFIWTNHAHYSNWKMRPDPELTRRLKMGCDWAYTPYKRAGDILCREELWDYKMRNPPVIKKWLRFSGQRVPMYEISRDDFLEMRRKEYRKYAQRYGLMFYANCAGTWCELDLAKKYYPDAISDQDPIANHLLKKWSTWHDWEIRVFSLGTSFGETFKSDMKTLTEELDLPGFAFDCANGGVSYYGPAVKKKLPGRAWDEKGVFIDQSIAVNDLVDFIHTIRPGMVAFCNGQIKGDLLMFERDFVRVDELAKMMPLYKWYIGGRPSVVHGGGYCFQELIANWRNLSQDEFKEVMTKLSVYEIFNQFKYGMALTFPIHFGVPDTVYIFPELFELRRAGWRANMPVKLEKSLYAPYKAAYGRNENIFLFFGNSGTEKSTGQVSVDNDQFTSYSGDRLVFVKKMRRGNTLANRIRGKFTNFRAILPSRVPVLYETACTINNAPEKMDLLARSSKDIDREIYTVEIKKSPEFTGSLKIRAIRGFDAVLKLNGKEIRPGSAQKLKAGDIITAEYKSRLFALKQKDITNFPFVDGKKNVSCKVWFDPMDKAAAKVAERFNEYFKFLKDKKLARQSKVAFVSDPALRGAAGVITLDSRAAKENISLTPAGGMLVAANGEKALDNAVDKLFDRMDVRFPYIFPFKSVPGMRQDVLKFFKMENKHLPLRKFFD